MQMGKTEQVFQRLSICIQPNFQQKNVADKIFCEKTWWPRDKHHHGASIRARQHEWRCAFKATSHCGNTTIRCRRMPIRLLLVLIHTRTSKIAKEVDLTKRNKDFYNCALVSHLICAPSQKSAPPPVHFPPQARYHSFCL